jgi:uncharacterized membrane protein YheB (UPF0754 family)
MKNEEIMKVATKIGLKSMAGISIARNVESSLKKREIDALTESIPDGSPLKDLIEKQKALTGDLDGLPPGHPLLMMLEKAKATYEEQQKMKAEEQVKAKVKNTNEKTKHARERILARREEEETESKRSLIVKDINLGTQTVLKEVRTLYGMAKMNEDILNEDPICRSKINRLVRLLHATERGLSDLKLTMGRS